MEIEDNIKRDLEVEKNKNEALTVADRLFRILTDPKFPKSTAAERHKLCIEKERNFAQAYPLVIAKLSTELRYSNKAFRRFLDGLHKNPGKGMEGFVENQAMYARYLYEEECKLKNKHIDMKIAHAQFESARSDMMKWVKDIKKKEKYAKNEYKDETQRNDDIKRRELLEYLNRTLPAPEQDSYQEIIDDFKIGK